MNEKEQKNALALAEYVAGMASVSHFDTLGVLSEAVLYFGSEVQRLKAAERVADAALLWREYAGIQPQDMSVTMARKRSEKDLVAAVDAYEKEKDNA